MALFIHHIRQTTPGSWTIRDGDGQLLGWIALQKCDHPRCLDAIASGKVYHATPVGNLLMGEYHYSDLYSAAVALSEANRRMI